MPGITYGATQAEWEAFASLNLRDLLPTVCDPNVPRSPKSSLTSSLDKNPSAIDKDGFGHGLLGWTSRVTTSVHDWMINDKLGICMIMRTIHAIDIDIKDIQAGKHVEGLIREHLGIDGMLLPVRSRPGTGSRALLFRLSDGPDSLKKQVVKAPGLGMVEFLFHKQQLRLAGRHRDGQRLEWPDGIPKQLSDIPAISMAELIDLMRMLARELGDAPPTLDLDGSNGITPAQRKASQVNTDDPVVRFLHEHGWVRDVRPDGLIDVHCPWASEHEHPTPDNVTEATFFPLGLGEVKTQPGFKCLHATCLTRNWQSFLSKIGFEDEAFSIVELPPGQKEKAPRPLFSYKGRSSVIESTLPNVTAALRWPDGFGYQLRYDAFKDAIVYRSNDDRTWHLLDDDTYTTFRLQLSRIGMDGNVAKEIVRDAVSLVARERAVDTAQEWLTSHQWDGHPRLMRFHHDVLRLDDTPYHQAVCLYLWTALVGRVMDPGCKADMVPIFMGKQGLRKSTFVEYLAPSPAEYAVISLANRDADIARQLRGKMVAEWDEMRGLNSRDAEAIKGWVSHRADEWVPKFKEYATAMPRRFILVGTANETQVHNDPTGARRWLPVKVNRPFDVEYVAQHREQLWAEALNIWRQTGIQWQNAERLAAPAHQASAVRDLWETVVRSWLESQGFREGWSSMQILQGALSIPPAHANSASYQRIRRIMVRLGWEENDAGRWYCALI